MKYDAIIIGGGPGGYTCAIRCGQLGIKTALIEEREIGGVCLNRGCVPTKALYSASSLIQKAKAGGGMGLDFPPPSLDLERLAGWKEGIVSTLRDGISTLLEKNGVTVIEGRGRLVGKEEVELEGKERIAAERIVLATGSSPVEIPSFPFSSPYVWSSDDALTVSEIPERLAVIGGGVIGLELATIYRRLGSEVTVIELLPEILSTVDLDRRAISLIKRSFNKEKIGLLTGTAATGFEEIGGGIIIHTSSGTAIEADRVLVAVGRRPNSSGVGLESVGITPEKRGSIRVDQRFETDARGIFAIGDLIAGPMLAHKASAEGVGLADSFAGGRISIDYDSIPQAIFTSPEVAAVGLSERRAKEEGYEILVGRFPYAALGKALGMNEPEGFFQLVADAKTKRILGVQIVGAEASDLISEAALAVQQGLTLEAIADSIHPHPTLPEGLKEAAENALGRAIHTINR